MNRKIVFFTTGSFAITIGGSDYFLRIGIIENSDKNRVFISEGNDNSKITEENRLGKFLRKKSNDEQAKVLEEITLGLEVAACEDNFENSPQSEVHRKTVEVIKNFKKDLECPSDKACSMSAD